MHGDANDDIVQVKVRLAFVLNVDVRLAARDGGPAVDGERHLRLVPRLHAPLEDTQGAACRKGAIGVLETQHTAARVQPFVDVGVRLELKLLPCVVGDQHTKAGCLLAVDLQRHRPLHLHVLHPAVLVQQHRQLLLHQQVNWLLLLRGHRRRRSGGPPAQRRRVHLHRLALGLQRRQQVVACFLAAPQLHAPRGATLFVGRPRLGCRKAGPAVDVVHPAHAGPHPRPAAHPAAGNAAGDGVGKLRQLALSLHRLALNLCLFDLHRLALHDVLGVVDLALDDHLVQLLFVALHVRVLLHLRSCDVLLEAVGNHLIERKD
mmetsp:Transcript_7676/g.13808  ORF Transcript_7676/g.13808 Transcript_7676/m.13808 type:complete len:318 (+) Transcript_7676:387-1340(+)